MAEEGVAVHGDSSSHVPRVMLLSLAINVLGSFGLLPAYALPNMWSLIGEAHLYSYLHMLFQIFGHFFNYTVQQRHS
jgi:hypothetical protein